MLPNASNMLQLRTMFLEKNPSLKYNRGNAQQALMRSDSIEGALALLVELSVPVEVKPKDSTLTKELTENDMKKREREREGRRGKPF